jgi:hypothetical protein
MLLRFVVCADLGRVREFTGIHDCLQRTITEDGLHGLYKGVQLAVLEVVVYRSISVPLSIFLKKFLITALSVRFSCILLCGPNWSEQ